MLFWTKVFTASAKFASGRVVMSVRPDIKVPTVTLTPGCCAHCVAMFNFVLFVRINKDEWKWLVGFVCVDLFCCL